MRRGLRTPGSSKLLHDPPRELAVETGACVETPVLSESLASIMQLLEVVKWSTK